MGFLDELMAGQQSLQAAPQPMPMNGGGVRPGLNSVLNTIKPFIHDMKNRNLQDMQAIDNMRRQNQMQSIFQGQQLQPQNPGGQMDVINRTQAPTTLLPKVDPNRISALDTEKIRLGRDELKLKGRELDQKDKFGSDKSELERQKQELNELKNQQIYDTKIKDLERKTTEADGKLKVAQDRLAADTTSAAGTLAFKQAELAAAKSKHELDLALKQKEFDDTKRMTDAKIKQMQDELDQNSKTTTTETDSDGEVSTKVTTKGGPKTVAPVKPTNTPIIPQAPVIPQATVTPNLPIVPAQPRPTSTSSGVTTKTPPKLNEVRTMKDGTKAKWDGKNFIPVGAKK